MSIKDTFILKHLHVKAILGRKKLSSPNWSLKWRFFFENLRV